MTTSRTTPVVAPVNGSHAVTGDAGGPEASARSAPDQRSRSSTPSDADGNDAVWARLAASMPAGVVAWRQDGAPIARRGGYYARFVAYIEANTVRERLDSVVPGEWELALDALPPRSGGAGSTDGAPAFKARLRIRGVVREDVGSGRDYKAAATDAFKRAAVRFGIGHELYALKENWVEVDRPGRNAKPLEPPQAAYDRRYATGQ